MVARRTIGALLGGSTTGSMAGGWVLGGGGRPSVCGPRLYGNLFALTLIQIVGSMVVYGVSLLGALTAGAVAATLVGLRFTVSRDRGGC